MEFRFKRKYNTFFILALALHILVLLFWVSFPNDILETETAKGTIALLLLVNCELILIFYLGLFRKKYYAFNNRFVIKHSFTQNTVIEYSKIIRIKESPSDTVFLVFGKRPSFKITYTDSKGKTKKEVVRSDNTTLLLKVIKNEMDISKINNTNPKKLTK